MNRRKTKGMVHVTTRPPQVKRSSSAAEYLPQPGEAVAPADAKRHPFIRAWLDEAGLTPSQFRMFCHLARRGSCFESLAAMSRCCHMRRPTIQAALNELRQRKLITKESRLGCTCTYALAPSPKEALGSKATPPKRGTTSQPKRGTTHLAQKRHYKGSPTEGSPTKGEAPAEEKVSLSDRQIKDLKDQKEWLEKEMDKIMKAQPEVAGGEIKWSKPARETYREYSNRKEEIERQLGYRK